MPLLDTTSLGPALGVAEATEDEWPSAPRRGRGPVRRQAPGAGLREAAGRPGLPGNGGSVSVAARAFRVSRPTVRAVKDGTYAVQDDVN